MPHLTYADKSPIHWTTGASPFSLTLRCEPRNPLRRKERAVVCTSTESFYRHKWRWREGNAKNDFYRGKSWSLAEHVEFTRLIQATGLSTVGHSRWMIRYYSASQKPLATKKATRMRKRNRLQKWDGRRPLQISSCKLRSIRWPSTSIYFTISCWFIETCLRQRLPKLDRIQRKKEL